LPEYTRFRASISSLFKDAYGSRREVLEGDEHGDNELGGYK